MSATIESITSSLKQEELIKVADYIDNIEKKRDRGHITEVDSDFVEFKKTDAYVRLDLACGNSKKEGFIGIDISKNTQADLICNLEDFTWSLFPAIEDMMIVYDFLDENYQIKNNSIDEIFCSHYIEHVSDLQSFANELYRIMKPKGKITFLAPYYSSIRAMQDPTHKNFISEATFLYWNKDWMQINGLSHYDIDCNFAILSRKFIYHPEWTLKSEAAKEYARQHYINVVSDIEVILQAIK